MVAGADPEMLAGRFRIERELGRGGMATVYLAEDTRHDRLVAIKVMRPELTSVLGAERFLREIRTAARLQHPHILPLHDSDEADGLLYYVMPYVEGESLRDRLHRESQLPLDDALRIVAEVADALDYAHRQDVVHRDIKPENILLSGGHALVMDFGIARAISSASGDKLTQTGLAIGTPAYMPPEQASGERAIDGRTDTYALGCVLYEMLSGNPPFTGSTAQAVVARHLVDPVPPIRTVRPEVPVAVERAVSRALAKSPADRFPTAGAFHAACVERPTGDRSWVRRGLALAAVGAVVAAGYLVLTPVRELPGPEAIESAPSVAVLAFRNVGGDPNHEAFSDGLSEEVATTLGRAGGLSVRAPRSAFSFKGRDIPLREIGRQLGVRYLLDGSVQRAGDRMRVRVALVRADNDSTVWADEFDRPQGEVFAIQDEIARAIAGELRVHLAASSGRTIARRSTESPEAHDRYLQGRFFFEKRDSASLRRAQDYFEQAVSMDSSYALAYAGLSDVLSHRSVFGYVPPRESFPRAREHAEQALRLDSTLAEGHSSLGFIQLFYEWNWEGAEREFQEALRLGPSYPSAYLWRAWLLMVTNRPDEGIAEVRRAVALDPFSPLINTRMVTLLHLGGRLDDALKQADRTRELDSTFFQIRAERARVLASLGKCTEALVEVETTPLQLAAQLMGSRGLVNATCGRRSAAVADLDTLQALRRSGHYVSSYGMAVIHAVLGDTDHAFAQLERGFADRDWGMFLLQIEPAFVRMRGDPRFANLLRRMGLPS